MRNTIEGMKRVKGVWYIKHNGNWITAGLSVEEAFIMANYMLSGVI